MLTKKIIIGLSVFSLSFALASTSFAAESGEGGFNSLLDQMGNRIEVEEQAGTAQAAGKSPAAETQGVKPKVECAKGSDRNLLTSVAKINCWDLATGS